MQRIRIVFVGACLCAFSSCLAAVASSLHIRIDPHIKGSSPANDTIKPIILKFDLLKDGLFVRSCHGVHFSHSRGHFLYYWILPAECMDKTKSDMIAVKYGYKDNSWAKYYFKDIYYEIHPKYDEATKAHNIALVGLPYHFYLDEESGYKNVILPSAMDHFDNKTLELYEYKDHEINNIEWHGKVLYSVKTKAISSVWCKILYPLSPIKNYRICVSGLFGKGLLEDDLGVPLIARDGDSFKLVGLTTVIRPWTNVVSFPIEVLRIQSYLDWIKYFSGEE